MFKQHKDKIFIDGIEIPLDVFLRLEPSYSYPKDIVVMFYDGRRRNYRTEHGSWSIMGPWAEGDRYIARRNDFFRLASEERNDDLAVVSEVAKARPDAPVETPEAKYVSEVKADVELHERGDLVEGGTEGVRAPRKRPPGRRNKRGGGAT